MSNCLIFALARWFKEGGYLIIRKSRHGPWPHFIWARAVSDVEQYVPLNPRISLLWPFFRGYIKRDDA